MTRALVQSLLAKEAFDEVDMAKRFAQEYKKDPDRGYGAAVITVFKKLLNPKCIDVFEPARAQFNGKGSYGNGGAMRVAGISLAYSNTKDVQKFARLSAQLTHASSLGYNGATLQALAVHLALQGESSREQFLQQLLDHMEEVENDDRSLSEARELGMEERPYLNKLKKIGEFLEQGLMTKEEVLSELASRGHSSTPSPWGGTPTLSPPWPGPLLGPTMAWSRFQRAGSKAVRATKRQMCWPGTCISSSARTCEGCGQGTFRQQRLAGSKPWGLPCLLACPLLKHGALYGDWEWGMGRGTLYFIGEWYRCGPLVWPHTTFGMAHMMV
ncbi:ADP-ribosylhydrolase ARH3 isoform X2 [Monodelphis domestica]|uniref:ADP-ribosylhydrolase ARH3 isoform X2 n=1 Tax=Monodelphis domestica TaxID=13616 RepID=UPI0024E266D3|nr:ADP-ribosylhydrolase ARH3 isoform X2 [Monodelphis domestica]